MRLTSEMSTMINNASFEVLPAPEVGVALGQVSNLPEQHQLLAHQAPEMSYPLPAKKNKDRVLTPEEQIRLAANRAARKVAEEKAVVAKQKAAAAKREAVTNEAIERDLKRRCVYDMSRVQGYECAGCGSVYGLCNC